MKLLHLFVVVLLLSFVACSTPTPKPKDPTAMPSWILNPSMNGSMGAVGVAGRTYDQSISTQRKLAIKRALDELSLQKKVTVNLQMQKTEVVTNSSAYLNTTDKSTYTSKATLTAHIQEVWMDKVTKELYVWMVLDK